MNLQKFEAGAEPPPIWEQLRVWAEKVNKTKEYATLILNYTEYLKGEAYAKEAKRLDEHPTISKYSDEHWAKTDAGITFYIYIHLVYMF